jgi:hypothetical protein
VGEVYNLCRVKTDVLAVLMVKSGLDPHMIIEVQDELNHEPCLWLWLSWTMLMVMVMLMLYIFSLSFNMRFGMNLYHSN